MDILIMILFSLLLSSFLTFLLEYFILYKDKHEFKKLSLSYELYSIIKYGIRN